ncbi:Na+/H+ antiporter subunit C [Pseudoroseicyclus tamaricis]|uniref:Na+/H+ antiporter subunit C n=1 Tax=Pseudoroseicyclus tamaricis TaxID=2705421 RepID=A0A6B2JKK2_9RHOB|nr:Na+/H+ antiporter subunit C [Pseudoroseicyclus tamaricis]NDV02013.1 Na+/H+ antiporter subunit C [Pseudoroseicyclus tamaricis]
MEIVVASSVGVLTAGGVYLILRLRAFPVILGIAMLSYAVNVFLFSTGGLAVDAAPILGDHGEGGPYTDPLPQALVLTAIVISFGMTAVLVMIALGAYLDVGDDHINMGAALPEGETDGPEGRNSHSPNPLEDDAPVRFNP